MSSSTWIKKWSVQGSGGKTWVVSIDKNSSYGCSCPVWKFRRKVCKHIDLVMAGGVAETAILEAAPGNVGEVTIIEKTDGGRMVLYPLVPLGVSETTDLAATNIYDMLRAGVSMEKVNDYKSGYFTKESFARIHSHVLDHGRCIYSEWVKGKGWVKPVLVDAQSPLKVMRRDSATC